MERNPNIQKPWLGRTRTDAYKLPNEGFVYGCRVPHGLGVADVIIHLENVPVDKTKFLGPDYEAMNKLAAVMAIKSAAEASAFRKAHPVLRAPSKSLNSGKPLPSDKEKDHVYGKPPKKLTPIADVINNKFGDEWIQMNMFYQKDEPVFDDEASRHNLWKLSHPKMTKSYTLAKDYWAERMAGPRPKQRFCMHRFQNVPRRIDCWNDTPLKRDDDDLLNLPPTPPPEEDTTTPRKFVELNGNLTRTKGKREPLPSILRKSFTSRTLGLV